MKRIIAFLLVAVFAAFALCACGDDSSSTLSYTSIDAEVDKLISEYKTPSERIQIDMTKNDPSDDNIKFHYDEQGRISYYTFKFESQDIKISYAYVEDFVEVYAFSGSTCVHYTKILLPAFDAKVGFGVKEGYFFKGYQF